MSAPFTGQAFDRVDGRLKVCGRATYAAEFSLPRMAHAVLVLSTVPSGKVVYMDLAQARRAPGFLAALTPFDSPRLPQAGKAAINPPAGRVLSLLQDANVAYNAQPIAVVVAETLEHATAAANLVRVDYEASPAALDFKRARDAAYEPAKANRDAVNSLRGDPQAAMPGAAVQLQSVYATPVEHHNPMEPHATIATWSGDALTVYDSTQYVSGVKEELSKTLGIAPDSVTVISPFVGGGFGCKGSMWSHVALAAMASRRVGRPVKLVLQRPQMFAMVGNRPRTEQRIALGSDPNGALVAVRHDVIAETSQLEDWTEPSAVLTRMLYACPNVATTHRLLKLNVGTPTFMRAPGEASGSFALESAMDELAVRLGIDPIELRLRNYAQQDFGKGKPFSSKSLSECYRLGAERFGWSKRAAQAGSMRNGRWQVGMGMATATYPANRSAAQASATVLPNGDAIVRSGSQDLGTGTYTVMTQVAADALGIVPGRIRFELGDSRLPRAPASGGSQSVASVAPAVQAACLLARAKLIAMAVADPASPLYSRPSKQISVNGGRLQLSESPELGETIEALLSRSDGSPVTALVESRPGPEKEAYSMHSFGAVFAEAWVDADLGVVRIPRLVGVYGVGTLLNAKTARSQLMGGMVWGVGMALLEQSHRDPRYGRVVNANLAEYHLPVSADIGSIDVSFVPESDPHVNPLGAKGIGEIGITGVAAAIANAVYHATGKRIRELPITLDKLILNEVEA